MLSIAVVAHVDGGPERIELARTGRPLMNRRRFGRKVSRLVIQHKFASQDDGFEPQRGLVTGSASRTFSGSKHSKKRSHLPASV